MQFPTPRATITLVAVTSVAWLITSSAGLDDAAAVLAGFVPGRASGLVTGPGAVPFALTPLTATLVHAGFVHLAFNMLMLVICGRMVEAALGRWGVVLLYVLGAYAAAAAQYAVNPASLAPMVGASGAISALVGAYALLFGQRRATSMGPVANEAVHILWLAAAWIGLQILLNYAIGTEGPMIATAAHVGGFILGLLLARPILRFRYRNA
jgi:membrane associated rhomboid family serine protease